MTTQLVMMLQAVLYCNLNVVSYFKSLAHLIEQLEESACKLCRVFVHPSACNKSRTAERIFN
jgi:hypothetical protein